VQTVFCGMEHGKFHLDDPPPRDETPLIVTWSRLRRYKSVDIAIRAFVEILKQKPRARMQIIGRGPDWPRLRKLVAEMKLTETVEFTGHLPWSDLVDVLHRAHVFLNPSPKEGWGLTVIEANACGLPVVASDRPGLKDSVRHNETGLLVPYGDVQQMASAALSLLNDPQGWQSFSGSARTWAGTFTWERCGRESLAIFQAVADGNSGI
jgi:glycosyltransferase involved in cell wall biosynthesis